MYEDVLRFTLVQMLFRGCTLFFFLLFFCRCLSVFLFVYLSARVRVCVCVCVRARVRVYPSSSTRPPWAERYLLVQTQLLPRPINERKG